MTAPLSRFILGTVQFGLAYGISNVSGKVAEGEAAHILDAAREHGIGLLDCAAAYGDAEDVLARLDARGRGFGVITKTQPLSQAGSVAAVLARVDRSLALLGAPLDTIMVHHAGDLARDLEGEAGAAIWAGLQALKSSGQVRRIGISAYHADGPLKLAQRFSPDVMQLPVSILDQRLVADGTLSALAALGVEVHARSIFLQGAIFLDPARLPARLAHCAPRLAAFHALLARLGTSPLEAALSFIQLASGVNRIVAGVTSAKELDGLALHARAKPPVTDWSSFAMDDPILLDPSRWQG